MSYRAVFRPRAAKDVEDAYTWYESERPGLGDALKSAIEAAVTLLSHNPEFRPVLYRDLRRVSLRRFPYSLYYRIVGSDLDIVALLHHRRHPRVWRSRGREV